MKSGSNALRIMCAMALVFVAFAHRPEGASALDMSAYILPDGSTPILCLNDAKEGRNGSKTSLGCEFCRLADATDLPEPETNVRHVPSMARANFVGNPFCFASNMRFTPGSPPTGPPA